MDKNEKGPARPPEAAPLHQDAVHCEACGARLAPAVFACRICGHDNAEHRARLEKKEKDLMRQGEGTREGTREGPGVGTRTAAAARQVPAPAAPEPQTRTRPIGSDLAAWTSFQPAPRVPAPLRAARPGRRFSPVAGRIVETPPGPGGNGSGVSVDEEGVLVLERQQDITPTWLYGTILSACIIGFFFSFVWWASPAAIMTNVWRGSFLILMALFTIVGASVMVRLSRKERLVPRAKGVAARKVRGAQTLVVRKAMGARAYAVRRKDGMVRLVHNARDSVKHTGASLKASGTQFRDGFSGEGKPNFLVRALHGTVRLGVWAYLKVRGTLLLLVRIVLGVLRIVRAVMIQLLRAGWILYRFLVEPVAKTALRSAQWIGGVAYVTLRTVVWVLWRIFHWIVRRWPFVYLTQALETPMRVHVSPAIASADVHVSGVLRVRVREPVARTAAPQVTAQRLSSRTRKAEHLIEVQEERRETLSNRLVVVPPEERWRRFREERRRKKQQIKEDKEAVKQAQLDAAAAARALKQAKKDAEDEYKRRLKEAKGEGKKLSKDEKRELRRQVFSAFLPEQEFEEVEEVKRAPLWNRKKEKEKEKEKEEKEEEDQAEQVTPGAGPAEADEQAQEKAAEEREKEELKRQKALQKEAAKRERQERSEARKEARREKKARKQAEKDAKPVLKGRLRRMRKEGKKPTKEEREALEEQIVEELTAKLLGRSVSRPSPPPSGPPSVKEPEHQEDAAGKPTPVDAKEDPPGEEKENKKEQKAREKEEKKRAKEEAKRAREEAKRAKKEERERKRAEKGQREARPDDADPADEPAPTKEAGEGAGTGSAEEAGEERPASVETGGGKA